MPTYDYVCDACGHEMELFQRITESPKKKCPECGKSKLRRLIGTGGAVLFKGSGFYETDYRSDNYKKSAEKDKPDTGGEKSSDKGGEGKPSKPDKKPSSPAKPMSSEEATQLVNRAKENTAKRNKKASS